MQTLTASTELVVEHCCACGIAFAMPRDLYTRRREDHKTFYCPKGHSQHYVVKSDTERLRGQLAAAKDHAETLRRQRDRAENSGRALKGHLTRLRRRIAHGVCPCCGRTFKQLSQHMERMHPHYVEKHGTHDKSEAPAA